MAEKYLPNLLTARKEVLEKMLSKAGDAALMVDIWSDRRQHLFIGNTGHEFENGVLNTHLVHNKSFSGSHTRTRIAEALKELLTKENIYSKVHFIVTDNTSNMKRAALFLILIMQM